MKLTIDNHDGKGAVDYSGSVLAGRPFRIVRRLNEPVTCAAALLPGSLAMPARNGRITVSDDDGNLLFTGYIAMEPALELAGQGTEAAVYAALVTAISDDILLSRQPLPQTARSTGITAQQALQQLLLRLETSGIQTSSAPSTQLVSQFQPDSAHTWAANAGALANATRNAWRLMNGTLTMAPVGSVSHALSETAGTLSLSQFQVALVKELANDVTVCGEIEPAAYVTEYFQGDGTTLLFNLTEAPFVESASKEKPLVDPFNGPTINPQYWNVEDPSGAIQLTSSGLTCNGGNGQYESTAVSAVSTLELGGSIILEAANVQFGAQSAGILNGLYNGGGLTPQSCILGFQLALAGAATTVTPLVNGTAAGTPFTAAAGHSYTLRLRFSSNEFQRMLQSYYVQGAQTGYQLFGGTGVNAPASALLEVQDTTNGVAGVPQVLYSGAIDNTPPWCYFAPLNASFLACSIGSISVEQMGPQWVTSTPPSGAPVVRRLGAAAQGADCTLERAGRLLFYSASTPQAGEQIAVCYRTRRRAVARLASSASVAAESQNGTLPGTACWMGAVTSPSPRSSADCENAASAILSLATSRAAAWTGKYTLWNPLQQTGDIWPGDVLAVASASAGVTANLVVRTVEIDLAASMPELVKYTVGFANEWADDLAIKTSAAVPADAWLPQQPESAPPLANLNTLAITSVTASVLAIAAGVTPPTGGGFEVRRRDWAFTPGPGPDLVLRSPVPNFTIPRSAATEQYYIRLYDGSTPPNYSRFSTAIFVNLPFTA